MRAFAFLFACTVATATVRTVTCSGDITSTLRTAINSSVDGDEVSISAGVCTTASMLTLVNKNIEVRGAGLDVTTITTTHVNSALGITMSNYAKALWRLHDFTLKNNASNPYGLIQIHGETAAQYSSGWRLDHLRLVGATGQATYLIPIHGVTFGLIDHVTFDLTLGGAGVNISGYMSSDATAFSPTGGTLNGYYNMQLPLDLGTDKAVYIEDCTFFNAGSGHAAFDSTQGGARIVMRHNSIEGVIYAHWTELSGVYGTKYEIYNNTVTCGGANGTFVRLEAGTGVIWGNTVNSCSVGIVIDERRGEQMETRTPLGACDGSHFWDGNIESSGWPCLGQVGRGSGAPGHQESAPLYAWNNGSDAGCATGGTCTNTVKIGVMQVGGPVRSTVFLKSTPHANGEVDFVNGGSTPMPGYHPLVYPHPLQGTKTTLVAPSNLNVIVH